MRNKLICLVIPLFILNFPYQAFSQKKTQGAEVITAADLESYVSFLASPLLKGRKNGEPGLEIAQQFIVSQAKVLGLKPVNGSGYLQQYTLVKSIMDPVNTKIQIAGKSNDTIAIMKPIYQLLPTGPSDFILEGEVVFAGYGLKQDKYLYNDFENIVAEGKILLIMAGAPTKPDRKEYLFEGIDSKNVPRFLSEKMPKLTAKVFRTWRCTKTVREELEKSGVKKDDPEYVKLFNAKMANLKVAEVANHKRKVPPNFDERLAKKEAHLKELKAQLARKKAEGKKTDSQGPDDLVGHQA